MGVQQNQNSDLKNYCLLSTANAFHNAVLKRTKLLFADGIEDASTTDSAKSEATKIGKKKVEMEQCLSKLMKKKKDLENELNKPRAVSEDLDSYRCEAKLYRMVSKITWDLSCSPDVIAGYITQNGLKTFNIEVSKHSQFFIVNHLWSLCASEDGTDVNDGKL